MTVDLGDLVDSLKREVSPPGTDLYPTVTDDAIWLGYLQDAFWESVLVGAVRGYRELDGIVTPDDAGAPDLARDLQQFIVLYAGYRIVLASMQNLRSQFRASAGPVTFEIQKSAMVARDVLKAIKDKIDAVLNRLTETYGTNVAAFDAVIDRTYAIYYGEQWWVR